MILSDLILNTYAITKRPDKVAETLGALQNALLKMHTRDFYSKDIVESGVAFDASATLQSLLYKSLFPLWRAVSYVQPVSLTAGVYTPSGTTLKQVNPQFTYDDYEIAKDNVYYEAGQVLQLRTYPAFQYYIIGFYQFPDIVGMQSWITQDYPFSVIYDAAATIFKSVGFLEQEASMRALVNEQVSLVQMSNVQATGY